MAGPIDVFISYAQADDKLRQELEAHLARLQRSGVIRAFDRAKIAAGVSRRESIEAHLRAAPVVLLLVSSDYLSSDDLHETDLRIAITRARASRAAASIRRPMSARAASDHVVGTRRWTDECTAASVVVGCET